jgi:DNA polymerase I-like protein with 3'-5' exonuclease and polymerase domains
MLSLNEVALRYGGGVKIDEVSLMWAQGVDTHLIPKDLLLRYLAGDVASGYDGDIQNTHRVFAGQHRQASQTQYGARNMDLQMGALIATIEMKRNGLMVDTDLAEEHRELLLQRISALQESMKGHIPANLPPEVAFTWTNRYHLSPLLFGGSIKYKARASVLDDDGKQTYATKEVTVETGEVYKSGKNVGLPKTRKERVPDLDKPKTRITEFEFALPGLIQPLPGTSPDDTGLYSVSSGAIESIALRYAAQVPFVGALASVATLSKDLKTYYYTTVVDPVTAEERRDKGMLTLVGDDGIVHHSISHVSTVTGRLSHSNPNTGNLPRAEGGPDSSRVKELFVSRFKGGVIASSDFSALEVYCQQWLTGDKQLLEDLTAGMDMHCARLSVVTGKPYEEVLRLCKGDKDHPPVKEWKNNRTNIKGYSFARAFGAGVPAIALQLGLPEDEVQKFVDADEARYPQITPWQQGTIKSINNAAVATGRFTMHPVLKRPVEIHSSDVRSPVDGTLFHFESGPSPEFLARKGQLGSFSPTEAKNYFVQGLGGEVMKAALTLMVRYLYRRPDLTDHIKLVLTVHDAGYIDVAPEKTQIGIPVLHACMTVAAEYLFALYGKTVPVPVPAETHFGASMADESNHMNADLLERAELHANWMREHYFP